MNQVTLRPHQTKTVKAMLYHKKGQVIVPTGGGKTMCMISDAINEFSRTNISQTIVVVAPRILLAQQLCEEFLEQINDVDVLHVHSGETHHTSTTKVDKIRQFNYQTACNNRNLLIFTTYHSLHRIQESNIVVDTVYFDEAHNSTAKNFFPSVEYYSAEADRCYFFTATPKHSLTISKPGMNDGYVYGKVIVNIPAPKLVDEGYILPPKMIVKTIDVREEQVNESEHIVDTIDDISVKKVLICARSTKQIIKLIDQTNFTQELESRDYSCMYITAKTGAYIDGKKVNRDIFFDTLNTWGKDPDKRFVVLHHSILSEGINVKGLEAALFLRNMDIIGLSQTIGRVIRTGDNSKKYGLIVVPTWDKVGISTSKRLSGVVDTVFNKGEAAISKVRK
jgi:superfamily II DNA or RNA helicase